MPAPAPTPDHPDAALIGCEAELEALVIEWQLLDDAWPKGRTAMERWQIGRRHEECLTRIAELRELISIKRPLEDQRENDNRAAA